MEGHSLVTRPVILDLFCGAGGAAKGYADAGFDVVGVDINPQPRYPFEFIQADAMHVLEDLEYTGCWMLPPTQRTNRRCIDAGELNAIHASPPCQAYSSISNCRPGLAEKYPQLIEPVRELLEATSLPYVIENVPGSPLRRYGQLCGSQFGLQVEFNGQTYGLQRHRWFETNWPLPTPSCNHQYRAFPVYGNGAPGNFPHLRGPGYQAASREVMGIDWMTRDELNESIPPAYSRFVGCHLLDYITTSNRSEFDDCVSWLDGAA